MPPQSLNTEAIFPAAQWQKKVCRHHLHTTFGSVAVLRFSPGGKSQRELGPLRALPTVLVGTGRNGKGVDSLLQVFCRWEETQGTGDFLGTSGSGNAGCSLVAESAAVCCAGPEGGDPHGYTSPGGNVGFCNGTLSSAVPRGARVRWNYHRVLTSCTP